MYVVCLKMFVEIERDVDATMQIQMYIVYCKMHKWPRFTRFIDVLRKSQDPCEKLRVLAQQL